MSNRSRGERLATVKEALNEQGWLSDLSMEFEPLSSANLDHFQHALMKTQLVIEWALSTQDKFGAHPLRGTYLQSSLSRLGTELARLKAGAESPLFRIEEGKKRNKKGADPAKRRLMISVSVFLLEFGGNGIGPTAANAFLRERLTEVGYECSASTIRNFKTWVEDGQAGERHSSDWGESQEWYVEFINRELENYRRMELAASPLMQDVLCPKEWLVGLIQHNARQCLTLGSRAES